MAALATASRVAFVFIPYFKAITGVIMITGIAFGAQAGFLTGAIAAFASNFFFSQGPWTPWQMFAYGFAGFWAGLIFHGRQKWCKPWILGIFGFLSILLLVGPMLDCCTVFTVLSKLTWKNVLFIFGQGVPVNTVHGIGCGVTLMVLTKPLLYKLNRIQKKYGMMDGGQVQSEETSTIYPPYTKTQGLRPGAAAWAWKSRTTAPQSIWIRFMRKRNPGWMPRCRA